MNKYLDSLAGMLVHSRPKMSDDELSAFYSDIKEFISQNKDESAPEKAKDFLDRYDAIVKDAFYKKLVSIEKTLFFFKTVIVILLILSPLIFVLKIAFSF